jgi:hypothetical protein
MTGTRRSTMGDDVWETYDPGYIDPCDYEYGECERCMSMTYGSEKLCHDCRLEDEELELLEYDQTKGQRRAARREKGRMGPVRHLPGSFRPAKLPKPNVIVRG